MKGEEAMAAYTKAAELVKAGKYEEALAVPLLPSDRVVIESKIKRESASRPTK